MCFIQVLERVLAGMVPRFGVSLVEKLTPAPDLYGPFWLSMTLTLAVSLSSNLSRLLQLAINNVCLWQSLDCLCSAVMQKIGSFIFKK